MKNETNCWGLNEREIAQKLIHFREWKNQLDSQLWIERGEILQEFVQISSSVWYQFWLEIQKFTNSCYPLIFYEVKRERESLQYNGTCTTSMCTRIKKIDLHCTSLFLLLFIHSRLILNPIQVKLFRLKKEERRKKLRTTCNYIDSLEHKRLKLGCFYDIHEIQRLSIE